MHLKNLLILSLTKKIILITFHPVTLENNTAEGQFKELLGAVDELEETNLIFTKPNSDTNGRIIINLIDELCSKESRKGMLHLILLAS